MKMVKNNQSGDVDKFADGIEGLLSEYGKVQRGLIKQVTKKLYGADIDLRKSEDVHFDVLRMPRGQTALLMVEEESKEKLIDYQITIGRALEGRVKEYVMEIKSLLGGIKYLTITRR